MLHVNTPPPSGRARQPRLVVRAILAAALVAGAAPSGAAASDVVVECGPVSACSAADLGTMAATDVRIDLSGVEMTQSETTTDQASGAAEPSSPIGLLALLALALIMLGGAARRVREASDRRSR